MMVSQNAFRHVLSFIIFFFFFDRIAQWSHLVLGFCLKSFCYCFLNYKFCFTSIDWTVQMIWYFLTQFWQVICSWRHPFHLGCLICWRITGNSILMIFVFLWYGLLFLLFHFLFYLGPLGESGLRFVDFANIFQTINRDVLDILFCKFYSLPLWSLLFHSFFWL